MAKIYSVKELYYTLQGEGAQTGRAAVFLRFAGCNLWSGLEKDRMRAICQFCDTQFVGIDGVGGGRYKARDLAEKVNSVWMEYAPKPEKSKRHGKPYVILTGGEPLLQVDEMLILALKQQGFEIGLETNGTLAPPAGIDWICVSPKAGADLVLKTGQECKLVYPQEGQEPNQFEGLEFDHFFLQPMDGPEQDANIKAVVEYCQAHPQWRISLQTHKLLGID